MEIRKIDGSVLWSGDAPSLKAAVEQAVKELKSLARASLVGVNLDGASLVGANLARANLVGASLVGANLARANLVGASLVGASLARVNLVGANLARVNLVGASLVGASLDATTRLWTGETWKEYLVEVLPQLLAAGGRTVAEVVGAGAWDCHAWSNCPMAVAFGVHEEGDCPILLRPRVRQFVQLFDARLIPCPALPAPAVEVAK